VESYLVKPDDRDELAGLLHANSAFEHQPIFCVSEMSENDFPRLPVIQNEDLLVAITAFRDEPDYQSHLKQSRGLNSHKIDMINNKNTLILHPTAGSFMGNAGAAHTQS